MVAIMAADSGTANRRAAHDEHEQSAYNPPP